MELQDLGSSRAEAPQTNGPAEKWSPGSADGVSPPAYDSFGVSFSPPPPPPPHEKRPLLQQPLTHPYITNADDIIELQSDVPTTSQNPELSQNQQNAKKEKYIKPEVTDIPNTNFAIACMVALCFNLPVGVVAMYCSLRAVKAYQDGKRKLGERRSRWSIIFSLLGITITTVIISSVVLWIAVQGQKRISRHKAYGTKSGLNL
nr:hypothetical protein BaRGS_023135 [Batillaria attramentaria]